MKGRLLWIAALALLFTPITELSMPNAASQTPAHFQSWRQMLCYYNGLKKHGLERTMTFVYREDNSEEMYFYRDGKKCRL